MYGIQAINAANGWAMAITGAMIVISGLSVLSFIISRLHKIIEWADNPERGKGREEKRSDTDRALVLPEKMPSDIRDVAEIYRTLTSPIGTVFDLTGLFCLCGEHRLPHPHLTIRALRDAGLLIPAGEGRFTWSN